MPIARSSFTECWVAFVLSSRRRLDERHERQVDVDDVVLADVLLELADRLEEGQPLDVADGAADLDDHHVHALARRGGCEALISSVMCGITCTVRPR